MTGAVSEARVRCGDGQPGLPEGDRRTVGDRSGWLLCLPPYSPELNPIKNWFVKFKTLLSRAATQTVDGVYEALDRFTPSECLGYLYHCGYASG